MLQQSTALMTLNPTLNNMNVLQLLSNLKIQFNRTPINTKESILSELENHKPNFLIVSSGLPGTLELTEVISKAKQLYPRTKILVVVNDNDSGRLLNYLVASADAIIFTENLVESLEFAIKQVAKGQLFICGKSTQELRSSFLLQKTESKFEVGLLELLTDRELEVLNSLTQGINYKQISKLLFISESTVKTHINNIFTKLSVNDRTQAVLYALKHGIENLVNKPHIIKGLNVDPVQQ